MKFLNNKYCVIFIKLLWFFIGIIVFSFAVGLINYLTNNLIFPTDVPHDHVFEALKLNTLFILILILLSIFVGPILLFNYPFALLFKIGSLFGFVCSIILIVLGTKTRNKILKIILIIAGFVLWVLLGFFGGVSTLS